VRSAIRLVPLGLALSLAGCSSIGVPHWMWPFGSSEAPASTNATAGQLAPSAPPPTTPAPVLPPGDEAILSFQERADVFYKRLAQRRFNTLATYNDPTLRGYFENQDAYSDYYARLAQELTDAHFEKNRPLVAEMQEFSMEAPGRARVRYRLEGKSGLPLRFWSTSIEREDVWEQTNGRWWILPGKL